jgi:hypothetical protein
MTLLVLSVAVAQPVMANQTDAATAINSAKNTILTCYDAAKEAESAGANITLLEITLNNAGLLLSQAELAYSKNDYDGAQSLAVQSQTVLNGFTSTAQSSGLAALQQRNQDFLVNVVGSIIATLVVLVFGMLAWVYLKRKYTTEEYNTEGDKLNESSKL